MSAQQDVRDDAHRPAVGGEGDAFSASHLGRHELRHAVVQGCVFAELDAAGETEVTDLEVVAARVREEEFADLDFRAFI